ncbi:catalase/peroxidase HPI [Pseudoduganella sp. R-32]|uniref:catalase/peroxidase HPI n=1 Tax=Pseudoduganella sp. R-32 TaxID=3404061 RepID=UPI003CF933CA
MSNRKLAVLAMLAGLLPLFEPQLAYAADKVAGGQNWWPEKLDLQPLRQHSPESNPYGANFNYAKEFQSLDLKAVKKDINAALTNSQPWWPADYGNYGPFFIRMAWHSAGTYRVGDGRGGAASGQQRFEPLNSWPDNVSLDKARRLLWPVKQKYGRKISWADLMVLAGNVAMENMGFKTIGFAGGRTDAWEADKVFWGAENKWLGADRFSGKRELKGALAATQMGLIYVNPEGPEGKPDPIAAAADIRQAFGRMAMDDEEIVALIAGGHTFGKAHGAHKPEECVGADPAGAALEQQGLGWQNKCGKGNAEDSVTSGLEGSWTSNPIAFTTQYLDNLFAFDWVQSKSPAGATQWVPSTPDAANLTPDAHIAGKRHAPIMFTTDLSLKEDPEFRKIAKRFQQDPKLFADAFARAWFKLTHRDMGPSARYIGADVPKQAFLWQDPIPAPSYAAIGSQDAAQLKEKILSSGLSTQDLVKTAWAAAASYRGSDKRGGINSARIRLAPQKDWAVNEPEQLAKVLAKLETIQADFNKAQKGGKKVSLADLIVLGGNAAIEKAAKAGGHAVQVPFKPGRADVTQAQTDVKSFAVLEPKADGFRNYYDSESKLSPAEALVEKANLLNLTVPEMTVLIGGLRALDANYGHSANGVLTSKPGTLNNDFFVNLLAMDTKWNKAPGVDGLYEGRDRSSGELKWKATPVDLVFGSNSELRAVAEVYAANDSREKFVRDFVAAWNKVMNLDRFD